MSVLVGVWNRNDEPLDPALLPRAIRTLSHRSNGPARTWSSGSIGLAAIPSCDADSSQPEVASSGVVLAFDGRLDNRDELLADLPAAMRSADDAACALAGYAVFGDALPARLNGDFALALFDPHRRALLLARDPVGVRPLYYACRGARLAFGSEIKAILAHPDVTARPDDAYLADLLFGRLHLKFDQGRTCFDGILAVPPGHILTVTPERLMLRRYWDFDLTPAPRLTDRRECLEIFRALFTQAVRRRLRSASPVAVSVSGGLDSSSIFCVARAAAIEDAQLPAVLGVSYLAREGTACDERRYLDDLQARFGPIDRLPPLTEGFIASAADQVRAGETPLVDAQGNGTAEFYARIRDLGARVLLTGHWGDQVLCDRGYLLDLIRTLRWRRVRAHLAEYPTWFTDSNPAEFHSQFRREVVRDLIPAPLLRSARSARARWRPRGPRWYTKRLSDNPGLPDGPWPDEGAGRQARSLYRTFRSSFQTLCLDWNNKMAAAFGLNAAFPFLDRDLLAFLIAVPGDVQTPRGVPKALLRDAYADLIPRTIVERRWKADFTALVNGSVRDDYGAVAATIKCLRSAVDSGYVTASVVEAETAATGMAERTGCLASWALKDLVGLELWLREFPNVAEGR
jgi:asparagine synthase (glutamine-hydrolysing)